MNRIIAVVEGQAEQIFVRDVLASWFGPREVYLSARLVGKPGHKGGVGEYQRAQRDILALLKQEASTIITTMFDFYAMPDSWPGRQEAARATHARKACLVEQAILEDITKRIGGKFNPRRFIPYIQMYEFEALVFTRPEVLAEVVGEPALAQQLQTIRKKFKTPEEIDDSPKTAPSKRLEKLCRAYQKPLHGVIAAQRIGIEVMRLQCPHFNKWLAKLEKFGQQVGKE